MKRRTFIGGLAAVMMARSAEAATCAQIEKQVGGRIGIAAVDTRSGVRLNYRASEHFAMCSTFKWVLAAAVLAKADRDGIDLGYRLTYGASDLLPTSPVTAAHVGEGALSLEALCAAVVEVSDNAAANVLLKFVGGPASLTAYLRGLGDRETRLDRIEPELNTNLPDDPRDTTTPGQMVETMQKILVGDGLPTHSRDGLVNWMKNCETGRQRIRAGLPATWSAGDKTGTGSRGAVNDVAILWPPARAPILVAIYMSGSAASVDALSAAHARLGSLVAATFA